MASPQSLDKEFNAAYAKRGLQPSTGSVEPTRNARAEYKNNPTLRRGGINKEQLRVQPPDSTTTPRQHDFRAANDPNYDAANDSQYNETPDTSAAANQPTLSRLRRHMPTSGTAQKSSVAALSKLRTKRLALRARGRSTTLRIWAWAFPTWFSFQLLFAIISIVMLTVAVAVSELMSALTTPSINDSYWVTAGKKVAGVAFDYAAAAANFVNDAITSVTGINLGLLDPTNFFLLSYMLVFAYGMLVLLAIGFIYKITFLSPLSGKGAGLKWGTLLLAMVGYSTPVLNLLPWFLPWTVAVWLNPE